MNIHNFKMRLPVGVVIILVAIIVNSCRDNKPLAYDSIHEAVEKGDLGDVKRHLNRGAALNSRNIYGWTPLHIATFFGKTEIAKFLISKGADINTVAPFLGTALTIAKEKIADGVTKQNQREMIELLEKHGARRHEISDEEADREVKEILKKHYDDMITESKRLTQENEAEWAREYAEETGVSLPEAEKIVTAFFSELLEKQEKTPEETEEAVKRWRKGWPQKEKK